MKLLSLMKLSRCIIITKNSLKNSLNKRSFFCQVFLKIMLDILGDLCYNRSDTQKPVDRAALGRSGPFFARINPICKFFHSNYGLAKTQKNPEITGPPRQRGRRDPICKFFHTNLDPGRLKLTPAYTTCRTKILNSHPLILLLLSQSRRNYTEQKIPLSTTFPRKLTFGKFYCKI